MRNLERGERVVVGAVVSAHEPQPCPLVLRAVERIEGLGAVVAGVVVQRRGVSRNSRPGGSKKMDRPMSLATFLGSGKAAEVAALRASTDASVVVICNRLTSTQRENLEALFGARVLTDAELFAAT